MARESRAQREARYDRIALSYRTRPRAFDSCASLRRTFVRLRADLADAHDDLDAPSRSAWPSDGESCAALLSIGEQLEFLRDRAARLFTEHDYFAAFVLARRVGKLLSPGFMAPLTTEPRHVRPPRAVDLAIKRLLQAGLLPIRDDRVPRDATLARDQRLLTWYLELLG